MLPVLPAFATTDTAANVAIVQGFNDNVSQARDADGNVDRHPATFTGLDGRGTLVLRRRDDESHTFSLRARTQIYVPLERGAESPPNGTVLFLHNTSMGVGKFGSLSITTNASVTAITSARASDGTLLLTLDPTAQSTSVASASLLAGYTHTLSPRWSITERAGLAVTDTLSAPPIQAANGVVLDRRGLDGILPSSLTSLNRELGKLDTGSITLAYNYTYSPYSLDIATSPPAIGGPQGIHQVVPGLRLVHTFSDRLTSTTTVGMSITTPSRFEPDRSLNYFPVGSQQVALVGPRWTIRGLANLAYSAVNARLGLGPAVGFLGTIAGAPLSGGSFRRMYLVGTVQAQHQSVPAASGGTTALEVVGAGVEVRYGLNRWLGLYTGYDARLSSNFDPAAANFFRQIVFIGLSGYFSTDGSIPPIESVQSPYRPG